MTEVVKAVLWLFTGSIFIWWNPEARSHKKYRAPPNCIADYFIIQSSKI